MVNSLAVCTHPDVLLTSILKCSFAITVDNCYFRRKQPSYRCSKLSKRHLAPRAVELGLLIADAPHFLGKQPESPHLSLLTQSVLFGLSLEFKLDGCQLSLDRYFGSSIYRYELADPHGFQP